MVELITLPLLPAEPPKIRPTLARIHLHPPQPLAIPARSEFLPDEVGTREVQGPTMGPPSEVPIPEARPQDSTRLRDLCLGGLEAPARLASGQGTVVLLIRVESDGQVSQTTVQLSSGSTELDQAAQTCVTASLFEPRRAGLRAVPSWQRLHWNWAPAL